MHVRLLFPLLSFFALSLPSAADPIPTRTQDSWTASGPIDEAFAALDKRSFREAAEALERAGKDPMAQYLLGCLHRYGSLGKADVPRAIELFKAATRGKCVDAAVALSEVEKEAYLAATGAEKEAAQRRVEKALFRAFVLGSLPASAELSELYSDSGAGAGSGAQADRAIAWAGIAKAAGVAGAGAMEKGLQGAFPASVQGAKAVRKRIEADVKGARAKARGVIQVQVPAEMFFPLGEAPGRGDRGGAGSGATAEAAYDAADAAFQAKDYAAALRGFQPLAEGGHPEACFYVARIYEMGLAGTQDEAAACRMYERSAEGGVANAMSNLGFMYHRGSGVVKDMSKAVDYFLMAAYAGGFDGALNIGVAYGTGDGREKNLVESHAWNSIAADLGSEEALGNLGIAEKEMSQLDKLSAKTRRRDLEAELRGERTPKYPVPMPGGVAGTRRPAVVPPSTVPPSPVPPRTGAPSTDRPVPTASPAAPPVQDPVQEFTFKDELLGGVISHTAQIPSGWKVEGGVTWNPQDANAFVNVDAVAIGPDGSQVQFLPSSSFMYFNDLKLQGAPPHPQEGQWNGGSMFLNPGNGPEDFVTRVILRSYRPNAQNVKVLAVGEAAPVSQAFADLMAPMIQQASGGGQGVKTSHKAYSPLVRISYTERGQAFEEEFSFLYLRVDMTGDVQPGKTMTSTMWSVFEARAMRAPLGRLDESMGRLRGIAGSLQATRPWSAVVDELNGKLFTNPEEFQKLQNGNYEKAMGTIRALATPLTQSLQQVIARTQESWDREQDAQMRIRRAWAQMGGAGEASGGVRPLPGESPSGSSSGPRRRGGFRIK